MNLDNFISIIGCINIIFHYQEMRHVYNLQLIYIAKKYCKSALIPYCALAFATALADDVYQSFKIQTIYLDIDPNQS